MRRLPAAIAACCLLVAGCSAWMPPLAPDPSPISTPTPTIPPARSQEPFPLLTVETVGGECVDGACHRLINLEADGTLREVIPVTRIVGSVPRELLDALQVEMDQADFRRIRREPFTGTCPTAVDGQETIFTFHVPTGDQEIRSCKVAIDENHPLFRAVAAVMAFAGR